MTFVCITVCCSPGLGTDGAVDKLVKKTCEDADVFVYVCNGTGTFEETVNNSDLSANPYSIYNSITCTLNGYCIMVT